MDNLLRREELADILKVTTQTVRNYEKDGMPVIHIGKDRFPRYELTKVMEWIHNNEKKRFKND